MQHKTHEEKIAERLVEAKYHEWFPDNTLCAKMDITEALNEAVERGISIGRNLEKGEWLACLEGKDHAEKVIAAIRELFPTTPEEMGDRAIAAWHKAEHDKD